MLPRSVALLQGGEQQQRYCTDSDIVFRQVRSTQSQRPVSVKTATAASEGGGSAFGD